MIRSDGLMRLSAAVYHHRQTAAISAVPHMPSHIKVWCLHLCHWPASHCLQFSVSLLLTRFTHNLYTNNQQTASACFSKFYIMVPKTGQNSKERNLIMSEFRLKLGLWGCELKCVVCIELSDDISISWQTRKVLSKQHIPDKGPTTTILK